MTPVGKATLQVKSELSSSDDDGLQSQIRIALKHTLQAKQQGQWINRQPTPSCALQPSRCTSRDCRPRIVLSRTAQQWRSGPCTRRAFGCQWRQVRPQQSTVLSIFMQPREMGLRISLIRVVRKKYHLRTHPFSPLVLQLYRYSSGFPHVWRTTIAILRTPTCSEQTMSSEWALLDELLFVTGLAPLLGMNLRAELCEKLHASEASPDGVGGCLASIAQVRLDWKVEDPPSNMHDGCAAAARLRWGYTGLLADFPRELTSTNCNWKS